MTATRLMGVLFMLFAAGAGRGQDRETGFLDRSVAFGGREHRYQVYVPRQYDAASSWPVILFLHGSGERGEDGLKQTQVGLGSALRFHPERWPAIVVFPQIAEGDSWTGSAAQVGMAALEATLSEFRIDASRQYLTGLSLGGQGVWQLAFEHPERFAALVPVCGFVEGSERYPDFLPESDFGPYAFLARRLARIPIWIFHGDEDPVVPVEGARQMAAALTEAGARVRYSELPGVGHNAWDAAYGREELPVWLFQQQRNREGAPAKH